MLGHDGLVDAAPAEQPAVDLRVQRLDPPVHDLGKAGVAARPRAPAMPASRSSRGGAAGGQQLDAARGAARGPARPAPVLSETESSARRTGSGMASGLDGAAASAGRAASSGAAKSELLELLAQRAAVDAENPRGTALVAFGVVEHRAEQRLFDLAQHQIIEVRRAGGR